MLTSADLCDRCGVEVATRVDVARMIGGLSRYGVDHVWRAHGCGEAYSFGHFSRKMVRSGFAAEEGMPVVRPMCMCEHMDGKTALQVMIREEYQRVFVDKFGPNMTLTLLFRLPRGVVAWHNLGLVGVVRRGGELFLSREGESLLQIVREAHAAGCFEVSRFAGDNEVANAYTYLYLLKPKYRGVVAGRYGPRVMIAKLFEEISMDWIDWMSLPSLNFCVHINGGVTIGKLPGTPVTETLFSTFVKRIVDAKSVVTGVHVVQGGTCVQFMPVDVDDVHPFSSFDRASVVQLATGVSFLSTGTTVLSGSGLAVTFEPGIELHTVKGHVITGGKMGITVFLDGQVTVDIVDTNLTTDDANRNLFAVSVVCDDYGPDTLLGKWHRRQFDVLSTNARFMAPLAEFVVLGGRPNVALHDMPADLSVFCVHPGVTSYRRFGKALPIARCYDVGHNVCIVDTDNGHSDLRMNGCVKLSGEGGVGFVNHPYVQFDSGVYDGVVRADIDVNVHIIGDDYVIDRGGPSGSDGQYYSEVGTYIRIPCVDYLLACLRGDGARYRRRASHLLVAKDSMNSLYKFGDRVAWESMLAASAAMFDMSAVRTTGLRKGRSSVEIVPLEDATATWIDLLHSVVNWFDVSSDRDDFGSAVYKTFDFDLPDLVVKPGDVCVATSLTFD